MSIVHRRKFAILGAFACFIAAVGILLSDVHWGWIFLAAAALTLAPAFIIKNEIAKSASACLCTIFIICAAAEWYFMAHEGPKTRFEGVYKNVLAPEPVLGYRPEPKETSVQARCYRGDTLAYDVRYSTNATGWRVTPVHPEAKTAVVFFGCSFTFGEGLNDEESYPYITAQLLGPQYQVFNFGFHGYGPISFWHSWKMAS